MRKLPLIAVATFILLLFAGLKTTSAQTCNTGDGTGDGFVDGFDYIIWWNNFNTNSSGAANGDYNCDGSVNGFDYIIWWNNFGKNVGGGGGSTPTPTPTSSQPPPTGGSFPNPPSGSASDCGGFWCAMTPPYRLSNGQVGFDPQRIPIELQAWWLPSFGHIHWAANLPVGQRVSGNMNFNIRVTMHDNPSTLHAVEVYDESHNRPWYSSGLNRKCTDGSGQIYDGSKQITCAFNFNASVNTNNLSNQWHEFRLRTVQHTIDGNEFLNSSAVPFQVANGSTSDSAHSDAVTGQMKCNHPQTWSTNYSSIAGRGWYTDAGYTVGVIDCVPLAPLSKSAYSTYTFWVRASQETSSRLVVDFDKTHPIPATGPWSAVQGFPGITLLDKSGNVTSLQPVEVDLRKLQNGWHSIAARSDDAETHFTSCQYPLICNKDNRTSGIAKIWFFVQN